MEIKMRNTITEAIRDKQVVMFNYKSSLRFVEPHLLGISRTGRLTLSAWQLSGGSGEGWRDFHIDDMYNVNFSGRFFAKPRYGYNPFDSTMSEIIARL